jgi:hypothetical protein
MEMTFPPKEHPLKKYARSTALRMQERSPKFKRGLRDFIHQT